MFIIEYNRTVHKTLTSHNHQCLQVEPQKYGKLLAPLHRQSRNVRIHYLSSKDYVRCVLEVIINKSQLFLLSYNEWRKEFGGVFVV